MVAVRPAAPEVEDSATALPAGALPPPPPAVPNSRNPPTAMPAMPPVNMSPTPRRRSARRSARAWRRSLPPSSSASSAYEPPEPPDPPRPPAACEPPRAGSSTGRPACEPPRAPRPWLSAAFAAARASARVIRGSADAAAAAPAAPIACVLSESRKFEPGIGACGSTCGRACDLARLGPSTLGIRTVVRASCEFESSSPVAPQPGQETAPLRCLRQVLQ